MKLWSSRGTRSHEDVSCGIQSILFFTRLEGRGQLGKTLVKHFVSEVIPHKPRRYSAVSDPQTASQKICFSRRALRRINTSTFLFFSFNFCWFLDIFFFFCPFENVSWVHFNSLLSRGGKTFGFADRVYRTKHAQQTSHRRPAHTWLLHMVLDTRWFGENCCFVVPLCYIFNVLSQSFCHWASLLLLFFSFHISVSFVFFVFHRRCLRLTQLLETLKGQSIDSHTRSPFGNVCLKKRKEKKISRNCLTRKPKWNLSSP